MFADMYKTEMEQLKEWEQIEWIPNGSGTDTEQIGSGYWFKVEHVLFIIACLVVLSSYSVTKIITY